MSIAIQKFLQVLEELTSDFTENGNCCPEVSTGGGRGNV
jgi:hypothetical protein